jgi:predicted glycosyltransferase
MTMRVLFWVQHLLGSGHVKRALTLARAMSKEGLRVVVANGGMPAPWLGADGVELVQLPPVRATDLSFAGLLDAHGRPVDDGFRATRRDRLLAVFRELRPQVVITEMFPFGRRAFRFELIPLLEAAAAARPRPWRLCSVRDILVRKPHAEGYAWMLEQARAHYDRVLVHTDPRVIPFELTFPHARALGERLVETGYVVEPEVAESIDGRGEVLVSAGGGRVGAGLLEVALAARGRSRLRACPWRLIGGGNLSEAAFEKLGAALSEGVILERQRDDFPALLANSLLSVSQAGYNTVVEGLRFRKPMVLVPFETATETEQRTRAERMLELGLAEVVWESGLTPRRLASAIDRASRPRSSEWPALALDGGARAARLVASYAARSAPQDFGPPEVPR